MIILQLVLVIFLIFALTRVALRFRGGQLTVVEFCFWSLLFFVSALGIVFPDLTTKAAGILGIGRGVDLAIYASIVVLFYLVFRIYILIEDVRQEITELVRKIAIEKGKK